MWHQGFGERQEPVNELPIRKLLTEVGRFVAEEASLVVQNSVASLWSTSKALRPFEFPQQTLAVVPTVQKARNDPFYSTTTNQALWFRLGLDSESNSFSQGPTWRRCAADAACP